ncbi:MAG: aminotransferase class V-fold PLP-dependent enzyme [Planctomycetaceae bacterium]|nr:aminotransferase class V-fold PLP-dependent enzyme [Planctomycetaceae bacterium]
MSVSSIHKAWQFDPATIYLNHGSFGPSPAVVQNARQAWTLQLERQPMDFFVRRMEGYLEAASARLGQFVSADAADLCFVDNATTAMNVVAESTLLNEGDEVLLTDHEYGAVMRIWRRACERRGARIVVARLPDPLISQEAIVDAVFAASTPRTRIIVVSHVTSPTAVILPVEQICRRARAKGIAVCIDGPHAVAMVPVDLRKIDCDYYCASGHKWLCGPFGSGFLYVSRRRQSSIVPPVISWGGSVSGRPFRWQDELNWLGTRDPAPFLAIPAAIDFLESYGVDEFRRQTHAMASAARRRIADLTGLAPFTPDSAAWFGSMATCPLPDGESPPPGRRDPLQNQLWERHRIEIPVVHWHGRRLLRVSCHLYTTAEHIDLLMEALRTAL